MIFTVLNMRLHSLRTVYLVRLFVWCFALNLASAKFQNCKPAVAVLLPFLKPCCWLQVRSTLFNNSIWAILLSISLSKILTFITFYYDNLFVKRSVPTVCFAYTGEKPLAMRCFAHTGNPFHYFAKSVNDDAPC